MSLLSSLISALKFFLEWKAQEAKFKTIYSTHDRYEVQKNRVKIIRSDLQDAIARGAPVNELRVLENEQSAESKYLRTLQDHLDRWDGIQAR